jgi:hypothetical protein
MPSASFQPLNPCYEAAIRFVTVSPDMFPYFDRTFQQSQYPAILTPTTFSFDGYNLTAKTADISELNELSAQEYAFFPRQFGGELIHNATPIRFMGRQ